MDRGPRSLRVSLVRQCSKPSCGNPASALLAYSYADRLATIEDVASGEASPHLYALCAACADNLTPPRGWIVDDRRLRPRIFVPYEPARPVWE